MLAKVLEKRKSKEAQALLKTEADHAAVLAEKETLHREELDLKDAAHRRYTWVELTQPASCGRLSKQALVLPVAAIGNASGNLIHRGSALLRQQAEDWYNPCTR